MPKPPARHPVARRRAAAPAADPATPSAAIYGLAGPTLSPAERRFFARSNPLGFILFARNIEAPRQVAALVASLRRAVGRADAPVLIDQEGGRVARLRPPHWRHPPAAAKLAALAARDRRAGMEATWLNARVLADELAALGIDVDCTPVLDLRLPGAHDVIGDRAYGASPGIVAALGRQVCAGLLAGGVLPVIKHIPGHGRALVDSHASLPRVSASAKLLARTDFLPFAMLADAAPWAMTGHVVYDAIDPEAPATTSAIVVRRLIRKAIGFKGLLLSDDLAMKALAGSPAESATAALAAGCDVALHCPGRLDEMKAIAAVVPALSPAGLRRVRAGQRMAVRAAKAAPPFDRAAALARLDVLLSRVA